MIFSASMNQDQQTARRVRKRGGSCKNRTATLRQSDHFVVKRTGRNRVTNVLKKATDR